MDQLARIVIARDGDRDIRIRSLDVFINDEFAADVAFGKSVTREVPAGAHKVKVSNRLFSREAVVELKPGETARFQVGNVMGSLGVLLMGIGLPIYKVFIQQLPSAGNPVDAATVAASPGIVNM